MTIKNKAILTVLLMLTGCSTCDVFETKKEKITTEWLGKNQMTEDEVYAVCKEQISPIIEQINDKYQNMLPNECRSNSDFTQFYSLPSQLVTLLSKTESPAKDMDSGVANLITTAKNDCLSIDDKHTKAQLLFEPNISIHQRKKTFNTSNILCYLDQECKQLQENYWKQMNQCIYTENQLARYVTRVETICTGTMHLGGTGSSARGVRVQDYRHSPRKYCQLYPKAC